MEGRIGRGGGREGWREGAVYNPFSEPVRCRDMTSFLGWKWWYVHTV